MKNVSKSIVSCISATVAIGISGLVSYPAHADLVVKIVGAGVEGRGIAFYADWGIPPLKAKIE